MSALSRGWFLPPLVSCQSYWAGYTSKQERCRRCAHLSDEDDVASAELLLELAHQPLVELLVVAELRHRHVDHDALLRAELELLKRRELMWNFNEAKHLGG